MRHAEIDDPAHPVPAYRRATTHRPLVVLMLGLIAFLSVACDPSPDSESNGIARIARVRENAGINVLLITVDTLRADHLSAYGYPRRTSPAIDTLASQGVTFDNTFTYWPKTRGSFAALFTSLYASQHGLTVRERDLPEFNETLAEAFQGFGYRTAAAIDNPNLDRALGFAQGFDSYEQTWTRPETDELERTEVITRFGERFLQAKDENPFFLWLHYVNPHTPYEPPPEELERFRANNTRESELDVVIGYHGGINRKLAIDGERTLQDYVDRYDAEIAVSDRHIGRILEALDKHDLRSKTLVVFTSDHGESLGEHDYFFDHGYNLHRPTLHIPLVLSFPGVLPSAERVSAWASNLDIFPTMLDLTQVSLPPGIQGASLVPLIRGIDSDAHERLFFQNDRHQTAIADRKVKLIAVPELEGRPAHYELFDLRRDPWEQTDRYREFTTLVEPLKAELSSFQNLAVSWQQQTTIKRQGTPAVTDEDLSPLSRQLLCTLGYVDCAEDEAAPK